MGYQFHLEVIVDLMGIMTMLEESLQPEWRPGVLRRPTTKGGRPIILNDLPKIYKYI